MFRQQQRLCQSEQPILLGLKKIQTTNVNQEADTHTLSLSLNKDTTNRKKFSKKKKKMGYMTPPLPPPPPSTTL